MPVESKSTDKLVAIKDIIKSTMESISPEKRDELEEVKVEWSDIDRSGVGPLPNLRIKFMS